jgi:predicted aldo/keto reductase-like oxidoreductase
MLKKTLLSLAVVLFLSSLFISGAFAFTGQNCMSNGKLNVNCAKGLSTPKLNLLNTKLKQIYKTDETKQNYNNMMEVIHILLGRQGFKSVPSYNKSK